MPVGIKVEKGQSRKVGQSIEEVLVRRRIDSDAMVSRSVSSSLPSIRNDGPPPVIITKPRKEDPLVESLQEYCITLQTRVKELEDQLKYVAKATQRNELRVSLSVPNIHHNNTNTQHHTIHSSSNRHGHPHDIKTSSNNQLLESKEIKESLGDIDIKILNLKELFRDGVVNAIEEKRIAATKIAAQIRGYMARARLRHYRQGLATWKWERSRHSIFVLDIMIGNQLTLDTGLTVHRLKRDIKVLAKVYKVWAYTAKALAALRKEVRRDAEIMRLNKQREFLKSVWFELKKVCIGKFSRLHANEERQAMIDNIRHELSEKLKSDGKVGVPLDSDVETVMYRKICLQFIDRKRLLTLKTFMKILGGNMMDCRKNNAKARKQWLKKRAGKCFYAWSDHVYMVSEGLDRKRWKGPRKYEIRYNQKRVNTFARRRGLAYVWFPWSQFFRIEKAVKKSVQRQVARFVQENFIGMKAVLTEQRRLRKLTVSSWKEYGNLMTRKPFDAWSFFTKDIRSQNQQQMRLVNAYMRWKWRQRIILIMKTWRHQALFGRIDGLYTRKMLVDSLAQQKRFTTNLESFLGAQTVELENSREVVEREIKKRADVEKALTVSGQELNRQKMVCHHFNQELKRLQAIIEAMVLINPRQVQHLKSLQLEFKFKERHIVYKPDASVDSGALTDGAEEKKEEEKKEVDNEEQVLDDEVGDIAEEEKEQEEDEEEEVVNPPPLEIPDATNNKPVEANIVNTEAGSAVNTNNTENAEIQETINILKDEYPLALSSENQVLLDRIRWLISLILSAEKNEMDEDEQSAVESIDASQMSQNTSVVGGEAVPEAATGALVVPGAQPVPAVGPLAPIREDILSISKLIIPGKHNEFNEKDIQPEVAAKMLLALFDFITTGDVTAMAPNDRRSWLQFVMRSTRTEDTHKEEGIDIDTMKVSLKKTLKGISDQNNVEDAVELISNNTWRNTILGLKTMYRGVSQYVEHGEDFETPIGIYERIINMRETMHEVIKIQKHKYEKKMQDNMIRIQKEEVEAAEAAEAAAVGAMEASLAVPDVPIATIENDEQSLGTESLENPLEDDEEGGDEGDEDEDEDDTTKELNVYASNVGAMLGSKKKKSAFPSHFVVEDEEDDENDAFDE